MSPLKIRKSERNKRSFELFLINFRHRYVLSLQLISCTLNNLPVRDAGTGDGEETAGVPNFGRLLS